MKITQVGSNQTLVTFSNEDEVFYSYDTPVAGWVCGQGFWISERKYSRTTSKHVGKYANTANVRILNDEQVADKLTFYGLNK